jgi:ubiquinol-cytochrome c reductase cytochrome c1 subunit
MKWMILLALFFPISVIAAEAGYRLDPSPHDTRDLVSLQLGARTFVNYCLGCHSAQHVRYRSLAGIGLTEAQIRDNLMFTADKSGEPMKVGFSAKEGKQWFGVAPPDLSVVARSRGADWLYTYQRTFYRDSKSATGWNNALFPQVAMPHPLWEIQGPRTTTIESIIEEIDPNTKKVIGYLKTTLVLNENGVRTEKSEKLPAGKEYDTGTELTFSASPSAKLSAPAYDAMVRDLVNFLVYIGEPAAVNRKAIGIVVLFVLGVLFIFAYLLKKEFWKDVH